MSKTRNRRVRYRPPWRMTLSSVLLVVGVGALFLPHLEIQPLIGLVVAVAGVLIYLPVELVHVSHCPGTQTIELRYRGRSTIAPTRDVTKLVYVVSEADDEIYLEYANDSQKQLWEGPRVQAIARAVVDLLEIESDVRVS